MNIVIIGAGDVGKHLAALLSHRVYNVTLVDINHAKLAEAAELFDIGIRHGSGTNPALLESLFSPEAVLLSVTDNDEVNLVACSLAKKIGFTQTIARMRKLHYAQYEQINCGALFGVDHFIYPEQVAAYDILHKAMYPDSLSVESFAGGDIQMFTLKVPESWEHIDIPLSRIQLPKDAIIGLIERERGEIKFPHGDDCIYPGDEITIIGSRKTILESAMYFGVSQKALKYAVIAGGSILAMHIAQLLIDKGIFVKIIEGDSARCREIAEQIPGAMVLHHSPDDTHYFIEERLAEADIFIAAADNDATNILTAIIAKEFDVPQVAVFLIHHPHKEMLKKMKIYLTTSAKRCAANQIFSVLGTKVVTSISSLHPQAHIVELKIREGSPLDSKNLQELSSTIPADILVAMVRHQGATIVAKGNTVLHSGDSIILISHPRHIPTLQNLF